MEEKEFQIAEIGKVYGSDKDGNPVEQDFNVEALKNIADKLNEKNAEILVDKDHESMRSVLDRDTTAAGWAKDFRVDENKGLFAKINWTNVGKNMFDNKLFRWLSPVFKLNKNKQPIDLVSVALTNRPAQVDMEAINSEPIQISVAENPIEIVQETIDKFIEEKELQKKDTNNVSKTIEVYNMELTKDELIALIEDMIRTALEEKVEEKVEVKEEKEEVVAENADADTTVEEIKEEKVEEKVEDVKEEKEAVNSCDDEKDVVKMEVLNSMPEVKNPLDKDFSKMSNDEFWKYLKDNNITKI